MQDGSGAHQGLTSLFNASQSTIKVINVPATLGGFYPTSVPVDGDSHCAAYTWDGSDASHTPPNGGSAGLTLLNQNDSASNHIVGGNGCVDIARNAKGRGATDPATDEEYEYALDGVSVGVFPTQNSGVPTTLSVNDIKNIFSCDATGQAPKVTNWNQLTDATNTDANVIHRFLPASGSATRNFFLQQYLGVTSPNSFVGLGCTTSPIANPLNIQPVAQNIGSAVPNAERQFAIDAAYSQGNWTAQKNGVDPAGDVRNGIVLTSVCTGPGLTNCKAPTTLNEVASLAFFGQRPLTNVIRTDAPSYTAALSFVGVSSSGNGFICSTASSTHTQVANLITKFGFKPLTAKPAGTGLPTSYCRKL
jgi:hypothetical protein